ncbi:MAG: 6-carboxytetrahydropterin synthase [Burkholderiaceae bacterium]
MLLYAETTIEVSHRVLSPVAEREQIHGHSYWIRIYVLTDTDSPVPVEKLKKDLETVSKTIDHTHLNDKIPEGTMESIAIWFAKQFEATEYQVKKVSVSRKSMGIGVDYVLD